MLTFDAVTLKVRGTAGNFRIYAHKRHIYYFAINHSLTKKMYFYFLPKCSFLPLLHPYIYWVISCRSK